MPLVHNVVTPNLTGVSARWALLFVIPATSLTVFHPFCNFGCLGSEGFNSASHIVSVFLVMLTCSTSHTATWPVELSSSQFPTCHLSYCASATVTSKWIVPRLMQHLWTKSVFAVNCSHLLYSLVTLLTISKY